jgi:WD40 repeat protein
MQSALAFAIGPTTTIPDPVAVLAERVLHGMTAAPWKAAAAFLLVCVALAGGAVALAYHGAGPEAPADEPRAALRQRPAPDVEDLAPRDAFGDALPPGAIARLGTLRFRHWFPLGDVAYSPDGKLLATAGTNDRQIRLWDAVTGRMLASTPGEHAIVFTPGGERLFHAGGDVNAKARVLDIVHRKEEPSLIPAVNSQSLAMSPDGRAFAMDLWSAKPPHEVAAYDAATGRIRLRLGSHQGPVGAVRYSPDGKVIATAGDEAVIRLWDAATGKLLRRLDGHKAVKGDYQNMLAIAFSPDSKQLVSGGADKAVRLWDVGTGKELRRFGVHKGCVLCVAFTPDGKHVLTGGFDEPLRLWDVDSGKEVQRFPKRSEWAWRIAFAPKANTFAAVHWGCQAPRFWDVDTGREVPTHVAPESEVTGIVFSRDGRMVSTAGGDRVVRHWDVTTGRQLGRWDNLPPLLNCLERSPDGQVVATGDAAGIITLRQADSGQELRRMRGPKGWVVNLAFAPDGKTLASACDGGDVILWDVATGVELRRCKGHKESAAGVAFTPDGMTLASVDVNQTTVIIWQVDTGRELRRLKTRDLQNHAVAISPDGRLLLVAATGEKPVQLWELATGRELPPLVLPGNEQRMFALAFAPDGRTLATGGEDGVVRLWEMVSGQERRHFTGHTGWAHRVRFAPDGKRLASASNDTTAVVWDVVTPSAAERKRAAALTAKQAEALWSELAGGAESADRAMRVLAAAPTRTVALLQAKLKPMAKVDPAHVQRLIAQLDDAEFDLRERAAKELAALDEVALPALRTTESRSLEQRRRIETLLNRTSLVANPRIRQALRAVEILERIGTADARRILATLASGAPEARITMEARASTERLARRNASAP